MRLLDAAAAGQWLLQQGVRDARWRKQILEGFEASPLYVQSLSPGEVLYQFIRNPSLGDESPLRGSWFCLSGATQDGVAIFDGGAGRRHHKFDVTMHALALEGIAAQMDTNWQNQVGGAGGATQLFVPPMQIGRLRPSGAA